MSQFGTRTFMLFCFLFLASNSGQARTFKNGYVSFEMQDNWKCSLEQTEWVCRAEDPQEAKEAVIILTAKERGPADTFPLYEAHMNAPVTNVTPTGVSLLSSVKYKAQNKKINDQPWLDGLQQDSEVQNYFTRYLATVKDEIAILVTFSAHNKFYSKHSGNFNKTIQTLRVVASKNFGRAPDRPMNSNEKLGLTGESGAGFSDVGIGVDEAAGSGGKGFLKNKMVLGFLLMIAGLVLYIVMKMMSSKR